MADEISGQSDEAQQQENQQDGIVDPNRPRVLMVDDDAYLLRMMRLAIETDPPSFDLEMVSNGERAWRLYQQAKESGRPYVGLILDAIIPGLSGLALAARLREHDAQTRLAILTGYASDSSLEVAKRYKVSAFWAKPMTPQELIGWIQTWLQQPVPK